MGYDTKTIAQAWSLLDQATVRYQGADVGTVAALATGTNAVNYDQIFTRDFFVSGLAFLLAGKYEIVRNFLCATSDLQQTENSKNCFQAPRGLMPASFKVIKKNNKESLLISGVLITRSPHPIIEIFLKMISKSWFQYSPGVERGKLSIV